VLSSLFPSAAQPTAGLFIRERMFRVARRVPLVVVSPQPWFPFQGIIRLVRPRYRPATASDEVQEHIEVYFPRFIAFPGILRALDGFSMALCCLPTFRRLHRTFRFTLIDAHFAYPSGYAASLLGRWFGVPVTITLRGTEPSHLRRRAIRGSVVRALQRASRVFAVSDSLRQIAVGLGVPAAKTRVVGNGVDLTKFRPIPRQIARSQLGIPGDATVLVSVGGLVERKGFHRVIDTMPDLLERFPKLRYLIVGGPGPEGDISAELHAQIKRLGLERSVILLGTIAPERLNVPLSAADAFVLATRNEGWANVFLEAMACGLPVVTTNVGGNAEIVRDPSLGIVVPFGDPAQLRDAIGRALSSPWDRDAIIAYARANEWEQRIDVLVAEFSAVVHAFDATAGATEYA
jgi:glycosyltransferase involved in cell wall biosynthesis